LRCAFGNLTPSFTPLSLQVILKIIKHCKEAFPNPVAGMLLGLDTPDGILEVTNTSAYPADATEVDDDEPYEIKMMKALREVR
jgi:hypothetical protein